MSEVPATQRAVQIHYTPEYGELILDLYVEGKSLMEISKMDGSPSYGTLLRWIRDSDKLREGFEAARVARAIHFEEKALEIAEKSGGIDKDDAPGERLRFDIYKWGAESHDQSKFGKRVTVEGNADKPVVFKFVTGVPEPTSAQLQPKLDGKGMAIIEAVAIPLGHPDDQAMQQDLPLAVSSVTPPASAPPTLADQLLNNPYIPGKSKPPEPTE